MDKNTQTETSLRNLIWAITLNVFIVIFELIFGLLSRSMALISDALHNITDIGSMVLSYFGEKISKWPKTNKKTYGYKRAEVIIAFTNGTVLLAVTIFIVIEAIQRFFHPIEVLGLQMIIVASVALVGNGIATYLLEKNAHKNLNLKSAWLHSLQDAIFSLAVIVGAVIIYFTGWMWIDPLLSILISIFLLKAIYKIIIESIDMMLDSVPKDIDFSDVQKSIIEIEGVKSIKDLHIWQINAEDRFLSAHIITREMIEKERVKILAKIITFLKEKYLISHSTIQIVSEREIKEIGLECEHCN